MRKGILAAVASTIAVLAAPVAATEHVKKSGGKAVLVPSADVKWTDVEGVPGVKMAAVQGDPKKGANHAMHRLPAGFSAPVHHHTPDHYVTVVSGTLVLTVDGNETKLPPGSYFAFTGRKPHATRCEAGADCTLFVDARGKWDVVMVDVKAPAKKK